MLAIEPWTNVLLLIFFELIERAPKNYLGMDLNFTILLWKT